MRPRGKVGCILINVSRGEVIEENALVDALRSKSIRGAALDVFEEDPLPEKSRLWCFENVIISPHVTAFGGGIEVKRLGLLIKDNLMRFIKGKPLHNVVNFRKGYLVNAVVARIGNAKTGLKTMQLPVLR